jgi:tripartite-type tricarboxylate transporter receptor subunit TctC
MLSSKYTPTLGALLLLLPALFASLSAPSAASAPAAYPSKPIRIIATLSPGSQVDILSRILAEKLSASLGQQVIVENRPGAGGSIAAAAVASAPADGYTLLATANGHAINPSLYKRLPFDTARAFSGVALIGVVPSVIVSAPNKPYRSISDLVQAAKAQPGVLTYATAGVGSASHLALELFASMAKIDVVHVPYKGSAEAIIDLAGDRVDFSIAPIGSSLALVRDGKARALAVTTAERAALLPEAPTLEGAGVPGYRFDFWYAWFAPAGIPPDVLAKIVAELRKAVASEDVREKFRAQAVVEARVIPLLSGAALDRFVAEEIGRYARLVKQSGASSE